MDPQRKRTDRNLPVLFHSQQNTMTPLLGKTLTELQDITSALGMTKFTAKQIAHWLYVKRVRTIDEMTNLSKDNRSRLASEYTIGYEEPAGAARSKDGTIRYLFATPVGKQIETVYLPEHERATLCISSQIGCKMRCYFCMTGKQGFNGQLSAHQIINQIFAIPESQKLTNLVFMGMGEPLDNWEELRKALDIITAPWGMSWSPKRVTVSTIGQMQHLSDFLRESHCNLAISLHSPFADERQRLMPVQQAYPISEVIELLKTYDWTHQRELTFEYIVFRGLNDDKHHAQALLQLLKGLPCKVNLIRFHAIPDVELQTSDLKTMEALRDYLCQHGLMTTIRASRGEDIYAACGMLSSKKEEERRVKE